MKRHMSDSEPEVLDCCDDYDECSRLVIRGVAFTGKGEGDTTHGSWEVQARRQCS